jgi:pyruvate dehydrogenase E1 component alpha subunit
VDLKTYRYQGHSMSDPQKYRTKEEVDEFKGKDSIANLLDYLMRPESEGGRACITEDEWKAMQSEIKQIVLDAVEFAENAAEPDLSELATDTYAYPMKNLSPSENYVHGAKNPLL